MAEGRGKITMSKRIALHRCRRLSTIVLGCASILLPEAVQAQAPAPRFADEVYVEVVNLDVVALGEDGAPVPGLTADDFEVLDDGQPVRLSHFAVAGQDSQPGSTEPVHLVLLFDDSQVMPAERKAAFAGARSQVDRFLAAADQVMVARRGAGLRIEQPFTADRALLEAAFNRLERQTPGVPSDLSARKAVLDEIRLGDAASQNAMGPARPRLGEMQPNTELAAATSLSAVRAYAGRRRTEALQALGDLERLVAALAGLPGRKALLLVSPGYELRPGDDVYQAWIDKYHSTRAASGSGSVDLERQNFDLQDSLRQLAAAACANRVVFYSLSPAGLDGGAQARPDFRMLSSAGGAGDDITAESLRLLSEGTGGQAVPNLEAIDRIAARFESDVRLYYSLGYPSSHPGDGAWHTVEVRLRQPRVRVRSAAGYRAKTADQRSQERAAAALLFGLAENPLDAQVDLGPAKREKDGVYSVPVNVRIPLARLMLLPRGMEHEGKLALFFLSRDRDGALSPARKTETSIRIPNADMVTAMTRAGAYQVNLQLPPGEHRLAVAVRDDLAAVESALSVDVKVGEEQEGKKKSRRRKDAG
jgi:VWFA-related protein